MRLYNPATEAFTDQPAKSLGVWAQAGWVPADPEPEVVDLAEDDDVSSDAEVTAEDTGRGRHPSARANKDK